MATLSKWSSQYNSKATPPEVIKLPLTIAIRC